MLEVSLRGESLLLDLCEEVGGSLLGVGFGSLCGGCGALARVSEFGLRFAKLSREEVGNSRLTTP
jgi:hypothetical protein